MKVTSEDLEWAAERISEYEPTLDEEDVVTRRMARVEAFLRREAMSRLVTELAKETGVSKKMARKAINKYEKE